MHSAKKTYNRQSYRWAICVHILLILSYHSLAFEVSTTGCLFEHLPSPPLSPTELRERTVGARVESPVTVQPVLGYKFNQRHSRWQGRFG